MYSISTFYIKIIIHFPAKNNLVGNSREANVSFRTSSHKAKNIYARADNNNPPGVAHNRNTYRRLFTMTITE